MKLLLLNAVPIAFILLAGWMIYLDRSDWGWPFAAALLTTVTVKKIKES